MRQSGHEILARLIGRDIAAVKQNIAGTRQALADLLQLAGMGRQCRLIDSAGADAQHARIGMRKHMDGADVAHAAHIIGHLGQTVSGVVDHESGDALGLQILDQHIGIGDLGVDKGHRFGGFERFGSRGHGGRAAVGKQSGQALAAQALNVGCHKPLHQSRLGGGGWRNRQRGLRQIGEQFDLAIGKIALLCDFLGNRRQNRGVRARTAGFPFHEMCGLAQRQRRNLAGAERIDLLVIERRQLAGGQRGDLCGRQSRDLAGFEALDLCRRQPGNLRRCQAGNLFRGQ